MTDGIGFPQLYQLVFYIINSFVTGAVMGRCQQPLRYGVWDMASEIWSPWTSGPQDRTLIAQDTRKPSAYRQKRHEGRHGERPYRIQRFDLRMMNLSWFMKRSHFPGRKWCGNVDVSLLQNWIQSTLVCRISSHSACSVGPLHEWVFRIDSLPFGLPLRWIRWMCAPK